MSVRERERERAREREREQATNKENCKNMDEDAYGAEDKHMPRK